MAKSLLLNVLVDVLGNYVEGLSRENLKVAVWSGTIDLKNLKLKGTALDKLNLPIKVERGYLKKLHLKIPWASLESKPVVVELDGVYMQAGPVDLTNLSAEDSQRMIAMSTKKKLEEAERAIMSMVQKKEDLQSTAKKATYVQQLTAKIIDNLEVNITNLHIRYEDSTSIPGSIFSCGVTIESLCLTTTDEAWSARFVSRDLTKRKETAIHKLGTMENFGVYWNTSSYPLGTLDYRSWELHMLARIYTAMVASSSGDTTPASMKSTRPASVDFSLPNVQEPMNYLLAPPNSFSMKVAHREVCTETNPKLDVLMESTTIPFTIQSDQYQQLKLVSQEFRDMDRRKLLITHRPRDRPDKCPREWWYYAYSLVRGRDLDNNRTRMQLLHECIVAKRVYVPVLRRKLINKELIDPLIADFEQGLQSLHGKEEEQMERYQGVLPLSTLIAFHQTAAKEAVVEILRLRADPALLKQYIEKNAPPGFIKPVAAESKSFWGGSSAPAPGTKPKAGALEDTQAPKKATGGWFSMFSSAKPKPAEPVSTPASTPAKAAVQPGSPAAQKVVEKVADKAARTELQRGNIDASELEEDERLMHELEATLTKYSDEAAAAQDELFTLRVKVETSVNMSVVLYKQPVVFMDLSMRSRLEMRHSNLTMLFEMDKLSIEDVMSVHPTHHYMLSMLDAKQEQLVLDDDSHEDTVHVPRLDVGSGGFSTPIMTRKPKFCFIFENSGGNSSLRIKSCPVQIVWNEPCVQGLITCFAPPVSRFRNDAPLLEQSMNAIAAKISLPNTSGMVIDMEIYAPTIIIPEEYDADVGCIQLDTGKLLVHGDLNPDGMVWDVVIRAVNIGMPRQGTVKAGATPRSQGASTTDLTAQGEVECDYLIKPFDVRITVQMGPHEAADLKIGIKIAPHIEGQLDALKLVRLKYITDMVLRSLQVLPPPERLESEKRASDRNIYDSDEPCPAVVIRDSTAIPSGADIDYKRVKIDLDIVLPRMAVVLTVSAEHSVELALSSIILQVLRRAGDMNVMVNADSLLLTDSMRPEAYRAILWAATVPTSQREVQLTELSAKADSTTPIPLVRIAYRSMSTPLSPLFSGNQTELSIMCSSVRCGLDDATILRYAPFVTEFMVHYKKYYGVIAAGPTESEKIAGAETSGRESPSGKTKISRSAHVRRRQAPQTVARFGGTQIIFSVASVSLELLHDVSEMTAKEAAYEGAFSTEISDIFLQYNSKAALNELNAHITTIEIKDVRQSSRAFVYNTLFTRNVVSHVLPDTGAVASHSNDSPLPRAHHDKILSFHYTKQLDTLHSDVEVFLQDITSYVSVDIILAFVDLILSNIRALNEILVAMNGQQDIGDIVLERLRNLQIANAGGVPSTPVHAESVTKENELKESLNVSVTVRNPRLLLLDNPEVKNSKAIVSDCKIAFHFTQEKKSAKNGQRVEVKDTFHCSLQRAQVFVLSDVSENVNPHKIIAPTGVDIHAKRQSENGVMLSNSLNVGSEPISCRVSLNDVVLTNTILARSKLTKRQDKKELQSTEATKKQEQAMLLTMLTVQLSFAKVTVILLNDYRDVNIPLFRVALDHFAYYSSGAVSRMDGEGSMLVTADYYNTEVTEWEPVLEPWIPAVKVKRDANGTELSFLSRGVMQVNVTGAMCSCIYTTISLLTKIGQEGSAGERKQVHPLVVRNFLGTAVELQDSRTGESLVVLVDDSLFAVPPKSSNKTGGSRKHGSYKEEKYPDLFDLVLLGDHGGPRAPITQIPLRTTKSRLYHFLPISSGSATSSKNLRSEPVTEEVFENQRYYPMKFSWGEPWSQLGDPTKWTDSRAQPGREPRAVPLPPGWEWVDKDWRLDVGQVDVETDRDGWYYSNAFGSFTASRKNRRAQQPLDVVRRRRWFRTRAPKRLEADSAAVDQRPIPVFWEVIVNSDESSEIHITSGMAFQNNSPVAVEVEMIDAVNHGQGATLALQVQARSIMRMPFSVVNCYYFRVRPLAQEFGWSEKLPCKLKVDESSAHMHSVTQVGCTKPHHGSYFFVMHVAQKDKRITMTCSGSAVFTNLLPCPLSVLCSARDEGIDSTVLTPGASFCVSRVSVDAAMEMSFAVGAFTSVRPFKVAHLMGNPELVIWLQNREHLISGDKYPQLLSLTIGSAVSDEGVLEVRVFSQYQLVDLTDSAIMVRSDTSETSAPASTHAGAPNDYVARRSYQHEAMYSRKPIVEQIQSMENVEIESCWVQGLGGLTLFQSGGENKVSLGVNCGTGWLKDVSLDALTPTKTPIEISDTKAEMVYHYAVTLTRLPGLLAVTGVLKVMPCYTIVNYFGESIDLVDPSAKAHDQTRTFVVEPHTAKTWHQPACMSGTAVRLRTDSTTPSAGSFDINEIGTTLLLLPRKDGDAVAGSLPNHVVAHVEVKFSEPNESSYITVVIWRADVRILSDGRLDTSTAGLSVKNDTEYLVSAQQDNAEPLLQTLPPAIAKKYELLLHPHQWQAYGWVDSAIGSSLNVAITNAAGSRLSCVVNTLLVNTPQTVGNIVNLVVKTVGNGKVLYVTKLEKMVAKYTDTDKSPSTVKSGGSGSGDRSGDLILKFRFQSIGLSLLAERPTRRELFVAYVESLETSIRRVQESALENAMTSFDLKVRDIHVDNYTDASIYPVLLNSINSDERIQAEKQRRRQHNNSSLSMSETSHSSDNMSTKEDETGAEGAQEYRPFLRFSAMWERPRGQQAVIVKYLAVRVLELKVAIDTSTIYIYFLDLHKDLVQDPYFIDSNDPEGLMRYLHEYNCKALDTQLYRVNNSDVNADQVFRQAQAHKLFFEALIIHPIKITLTFTPTNMPSARGLAAVAELGGANNKLRLLPKVAAVEDFEIKISSFIVDHALESVRSMRQRVLTKTVVDLKAQMLQIAGNLVGSMTLLGKPAGLVKNVGGGVQDFFYEPYLGIMESPQAFIFGLGKGTGALITGVASGVLGSAANLVGTATSGVSTLAEGVVHLSGDDKYMRRREEKMRAAKTAQGGVLSGLQAGGESIFAGVSSGLTGLVTKPYEEGRKGGALGVVKGMGMGLLGAATKPVMGVTDGLSSIASGFSQQMQDPNSVVCHVRPQRALEKAELRDDAPLVLGRFDLFAAQAQQYVNKRKVFKSYNDEYLASSTLGYPRSSTRSAEAPFGVALSKQYVFLLTRDIHKIWQMAFAELSHVVLIDREQHPAVEFVRYTGAGAGGGAKENETVICASKSSALKVYTVLAKFAYRMGNPSAVVPVSEYMPAENGTTGVDRRDSPLGGLSSSGPGTSGTGVAGSAGNSQRRSSMLGAYKFGTVNIREYSCESNSEEHIFNITKARLSKISLATLQEPGGTDRYSMLLDDATWRLVCEWRHNHHVIFNPSRCAVCLVVNNTPHYVQVTEFELKEGKDFLVMGVGDGYDQDSRSLAAHGGAVVIFGYGYVPSLTDLAHVKIKIYTSAFTAMVSTRKNRSDCTNQNGFHAGFVEKVQADYWTKAVIVIN